MPAKRRNRSKSDTKGVVTEQPKKQQSQKNTQSNSDQVDIPLHHPPAEPDVHGPEKPKLRSRTRGKTMPVSTQPDSAPEMLDDKAIHTGNHGSRILPQEPSNEPPSKRSKSGLDRGATGPAKGKSAQRLTKVVPPREPLPDRTGRNVHPVKPKATRHTPKEVSAQRKAQIQDLEEKIREAEEAKELLAQMNVDEELNDDNMLVENPQRLSAAIRKYGQEHPKHSDGLEDFDFSAVENGVYSDDEVIEPLKKKPTVRQKKPTKGELRNDIESRAMKLRGVPEGGRINKTVTNADMMFAPSDKVPKKYQNSGLRRDQKVDRAPEAPDPFLSGGLNDEDAISIPPSSHTRERLQTRKPPTVAYPEVLQHDHSRKNNRVEVVDHNPNEVLKKNVPLKKSLRETKKQTSKAVANPTAAEFLQDARWTQVFIPSITHALYISREPFLDFTSDSPGFLAKTQEVFDISFPNVDFKLESNDPLVTMAYKRLNTRKSKIVSNVLQTIIAFFGKPEFANNPTKIKDYVRWAIRGDGPAYYKFPTPQNSKLARDHQDYEAPDGFLQSSFMALVAAQNLGYAKNSILYPPLDARHPPKGLYALLMAAVERGFTSFLRGMYVKPPLFAHENVWRPLKTFLLHVDRISERHWRLVLEPKDEESDLEDPHADEAMISAFRGDLYIPMSPQKA